MTSTTSLNWTLSRDTSDPCTASGSAPTESYTRQAARMAPFGFGRRPSARHTACGSASRGPLPRRVEEQTPPWPPMGSLLPRPAEHSPHHHNTTLLRNRPTSEDQLSIIRRQKFHLVLGQSLTLRLCFLSFNYRLFLEALVLRALYLLPHPLLRSANATGH